MKRMIFRKTVFLCTAVLCLLFVLCGCGITRKEVFAALPTSAIEKTDRVQQSIRTNTAEKFVIPASTPTAIPEYNLQKEEEESRPALYFTPEDTRTMSNYMLASRFIHDGKTLYGSRHDSEGNPYFSRMKYTAGASGMYVRESEVVENGVDMQYLIIQDNALFGLRTENSTGATSIVRYSLAKDSSLVPQRLYNGTCDYLFQHGERLYFTDGDNHLMSMNREGRDLEQIVSDKEVFFPYLISDDLLLFQDDASGESLSLRRLSDGKEITVSDGRVYEYVISGSDMYFSKVDDATDDYLDMRSKLCKLDINAALSEIEQKGTGNSEIQIEHADGYMGTRFAINGNHINASNYKTVSLENWRNISDDEYEVGYTAACQYVAENYEIFYDYNSEGLIDRELFYEPDVKRADYMELAKN